MKELVKRNEYSVISKADYVDKTTAGFVAQVVGMLTGYEFVTLPGKQDFITFGLNEAVSGYNVTVFEAEFKFTFKNC